MKKVNKKMKKLNNLAGGTGIRFLLFRRAIKRTREQLAFELGTQQVEIANIEKNTIYPKINYLHYLNRKYGLNINWLLCNVGEMFVKGPPPDVDTNYVMRPLIPADPDQNAKTIQLMQLMQIPSVEKAIMTKLREVIKHLREEE